MLILFAVNKIFSPFFSSVWFVYEFAFIEVFLVSDRIQADHQISKIKHWFLAQKKRGKRNF